MTTTDTTTRPDYWNPEHFKPGQPVMYGFDRGTVQGHYAEGMWNIRLPGGPACVSGADLKPITGKAGPREVLARRIRAARRVSIADDPARQSRRDALACMRGEASYNRLFGIGKAPKRKA